MKTQIDSQLLLLLKKDIKKHSLPHSFLTSILQRILPIAESINSVKLNKNKPIIISFNGAQGSGKSTLTYFISLLLSHHFKQKSINISLDDFYLSKLQRLQLSRQIHPLLQTRGVPGTHDLNLAVSTLKNLTHCSSLNPCFIPQFNKATDDLAKKEEWIKVENPIDIILFEGWCNHTPIQNKEELQSPVNSLEQDEDSDTKWRSFVNEQLKLYHQQLFSLCDQLYFIKIPSFEKVYEWRRLQEHKLSINKTQNKGMDKTELIRFIQHYERLTRHCINALPKIADAIIELDDNHQIKRTIYNET